MNSYPIVLIGPMGAGKTSIAEVLSSDLGIKHISLDECSFYYDEIGFSEERAGRLRNEDGWWASYHYRKPFEAHAVQRVLEDYPVSVMDFGAGHSSYEDPELLRAVSTALTHVDNVVLILPTPDLETSQVILSERREMSDEMREVNRYFLGCSSTRALAKHVVYTAGRNVAGVAQEIALLASRARPNNSFEPSPLLGSA